MAGGGREGCSPSLMWGKLNLVDKVGELGGGGGGGRAGGGGQEAQGMHPVQVPYHPSGREFQNVNMKGIYIHYVQHEMTYIYI